MKERRWILLRVPIVLGAIVFFVGTLLAITANIKGFASIVEERPESIDYFPSNPVFLFGCPKRIKNTTFDDAILKNPTFIAYLEWYFEFDLSQFFKG
jgi:hypothetical protein